ncbi:MAG: BolA/IbaG family iron-sulfur metabolism protein [Halieaceae bacterium]|nr:BolA/IbaG family iron-sulfur metabolism protein [Halieaceae bacterium]
MQPEQIQDLLVKQLHGCEVRVSGADRHFDIVVVGEVFDGLRPVKRQQLVYAVLADHIADGSIHAVNIRTFTSAERAAHQGPMQ